MPLDMEPADLIALRHSEYAEFRENWRWLMDSLEGGDRYRYATYGQDAYGYPAHNLTRHKHEVPGPSANPGNAPGVGPIGTSAYEVGVVSWGGQGASQADYGVSQRQAAREDDNFSLRLERTPVPGFVAEAIETHLSRIYAREVKRDGPDPLKAWWIDVDGRGTTIDEWMQNTIAPLLMVLGQLDLIFDHPAAPDDQEIVSQADVDRLDLSRCVASYILPENMLWWRLNPDGSYAECIVLEIQCDESGGVYEGFRYWTPIDSTLYQKIKDDEGKETDEVQVIDVTSHNFGHVPIVRVFDRRKFRCDNVGQPRYEIIAEIQREYYNRDSELILADTMAAHPILQGPSDAFEEGSGVIIGPSNILVKARNPNGSGVTYEGFDYLDPPKSGSESIRSNKNDLRDDADRAAALTKPAGARASTGSVVSQSGVSKRLDATVGNDMLGKIATVLGKAEKTMARYVLDVINEGKIIPTLYDSISIVYPKQFDLASSAELAADIAEFQGCLTAAGECLDVEVAMLKRLVRLSLVGLDDGEYDRLDQAIEDSVAARVTAQNQAAELAMATAAVDAADKQTDEDSASIGEAAD